MSAPLEIQKHCWTCRRETLHRLIQGIASRNLYSCTESCGAPAREVTDADGSTPAVIEREKAAHAATLERWRKDDVQSQERRTRTADELEPPRLAPRPVQKKETKTMSAASPIQQAIAAAVQESLTEFSAKMAALQERIKDLESKLEDAGASVTEKELDRKLERWNEENLGEYVQRTLLQQLAVSAAAPKLKAKKAGHVPAAAADALVKNKATCPRQPHKGNCPSKWCENAAKKKAAE